MLSQVDYSSFGAAVRSARLRQGKTQLNVSMVIGKTIPFISGIETGRFKSAAPETIIAWADCLGLNRKRLLKLGAPRRYRAWTTAINGGERETA